MRGGLYTTARRWLSRLNLEGLKWKQIQWRSRRLTRHAVFSDVSTFRMFIGYPRSGHSLIGSLLDAHPNIIIGHEVDALGIVSRGATQAELFTALLDNSEYYARFGRDWTGYSYSIPGQWQGRYENLRIIGDKKGGQSSLWIVRAPGILEKLRIILGPSVKIKVFHIVRNPYDNISTISRNDVCELPEAISRYSTLLSGVEAAQNYFAEDEWTTYWFEDVIAQPQEKLTALISDLGERASPDYLSSCSEILFERPRNTRSLVDWNPENLARVEALQARYPFLSRYRFNEA